MIAAECWCRLQQEVEQGESDGVRLSRSRRPMGPSPVVRTLNNCTVADNRAAAMPDSASSARTRSGRYGLTGVFGDGRDQASACGER